MAVTVFFAITGLVNFLAGFVLAMLFGLGPESFRDVLALLRGTLPTENRVHP